MHLSQIKYYRYLHVVCLCGTGSRVQAAPHLHVSEGLATVRTHIAANPDVARKARDMALKEYANGENGAKIVSEIPRAFASAEAFAMTLEACGELRFGANNCGGVWWVFVFEGFFIPNPTRRCQGSNLGHSAQTARWGSNVPLTSEQQSHG